MTSLHLDGDSCEPDEVFGVPDILPRIGDEFQVEIPPLSTEFNRFSHSDSTEPGKSAHYLPECFIGLPIPLTWMYPEPGIVTEDAIKTETNPNNEKFEISNDIRKPIRESHNLPVGDRSHCCVDQGSLLVPGMLSNEHWSDGEKDSFLLGLYIFQRNFVEVKRFVETKEMGAILSFYYGEFYGSNAYHRWSNGRKRKSKKCVYGQRIFSGLRQQELLSRVFPTLSEDRRDALLEVSKRFGDEKISLSDYVSSLKAMVGTDTFVKAIAIGKGKQDLTRMAVDPSRSSQVSLMRPEIPIGKACSTLTTSEIIKFLSGDYRLSKARSNDLFWEAVWPRLLARGWHSEQPTDHGLAVSFKNSLVFLVPGVMKFSRSELVKGDHYFDSITDILSKVAKDPVLIELDTTVVESEKNKEECILISGRKFEQDDDESPSRRVDCYLQPRTPDRNADIMEIMVVDTSLFGGRVRELRGLPTDTLNTLNSQEYTYWGALELTDESQSCESGRKTKQGGKMRLGVKDDRNVNNVLYQDSCNISVSNLNRKKDLHENKRPRKVPKSHLSQKPIRAEISSVNGTSTYCPSIHESTANLSSRTCSYPDKLSSTSSSKGSPSVNVECASYADTRTLIDLNMPPISLDSENGVFTKELIKEQDNRTSELDNDCLHNDSAIEARVEQQSFANLRRHSTRSRPPTTKALEALENGYLTVNRRRKSKDDSLQSEVVALRTSKRARVAGPTESTSSSVASQVQEAENGVSNSGTSKKFRDFRVLPDANEEPCSGK